VAEIILFRGEGDALVGFLLFSWLS
jgi:hypothetical protein